MVVKLLNRLRTMAFAKLKVQILWTLSSTKLVPLKRNLNFKFQMKFV